MPSSSMAPHLGVCVVVVRLTLAAAFAAKPSSLPGCWDGQHLIRRREAAPFKGFGSPVHVRGLRGGFSFEQAGGVLGMSASSIRVASYNVLSSCLCEPSYYCNSDPEALEPTKRLERVIGKLETECEKGAVVCLQEVSRQWSGDLHVFFAKRGYSMINVGYGGKNNGYMGVSLAYKLANYELMETGIEKVSDFKAWPKAPPPGRFKALRMYFAEVIRKLRRQRKPENEWADAERRHNCLVWARLKDRSSGKEVGVATYHMPCQFRIPSVMVIHTSLVAQRLHEVFGSATPLIWCGDFNFKPGDAPYRLLTEGTLDVQDPAYPKTRDFDPWQLTCPVKMQSAYKQKQGVEPAFTNWAQTRSSPVFMGTLDYIFVSEGCEATDVLPLPLEVPVPVAEGEAKPGDILGGPFPTKDEPSDHLLVAATINLP